VDRQDLSLQGVTVEESPRPWRWKVRELDGVRWRPRYETGAAAAPLPAG